MFLLLELDFFSLSRKFVISHFLNLARLEAIFIGLCLVAKLTRDRRSFRLHDGADPAGVHWEKREHLRPGKESSGSFGKREKVRS